jgi:hypothetical protein
LLCWTKDAFIFFVLIGGSKMNRKYLLVLALSVTFAIISIEAKRALPVQERGLVQAKITASSIVKEHAIHGTKTNIRFFDGPTLGYVTPWYAYLFLQLRLKNFRLPAFCHAHGVCQCRNGHGYDIAKKFKCKFDLISPVRLFSFFFRLQLVALYAPSLFAIG